MKGGAVVNSPQALAAKLAKQWQNPGRREERLLSPQAWPLELAIGQPGAEQFAGQSERILKHIEAWRSVNIGEVEWRKRNYRDAGEPVSIPVCWRLSKPSEWVRATGNAEIQADYSLLSKLISETDQRFHSLLLRQLSRIRELSASEILNIAEVAMQLQPGMAQGKPLRGLAIGGIDSKFFERNRRLLILMLDVLFEGEVSRQGLESFLGAVSENDHWLLLVSLQPGLLPFEQQRVRASELERKSLPAAKILIIENERCWHQLPKVFDCIAVLGAGLNLNWMRADWLMECRLGYWGDLDSWGFMMLGKARSYQSHVEALMMDRQVFDLYEKRSVIEPAPYQNHDLSGVTEQELQMFHYLLAREKGRLEQEFLPTEFVERMVSEWAL